MMLVKNEADRWLHEALRQARFLSDHVVVLDDASTDTTREIAYQYADEVLESAVSMFARDERFQRQRLWDTATRMARRGDWILGFDADELLPEDHVERLRLILTTKFLPGVDSMSFRLCDMWSDTHYRDDKFWTAHHRQWVRAVRFDPTAPNRWRDATHHCGSFPLGSEGVVGFTDLTIKHMGWSREQDRKAKFDRYMEADPDGALGWLEQYHSILDPEPHLVAL
ncbi:glycosyltransferase [Kineococcus endophyticus]